MAFGTYEDEDEGTFAESRCGVVVSGTPERPRIHLLEISENEGQLVNDNLHKACQAVRDQIFPDKPLSSIDWLYTNGICQSGIIYAEKAGILTEIRLTSDHLGGEYFKKSLQHYQNALDDPQGFDHVMTSGHGYATGKPVRLIAVPVPDHPEGTILMVGQYGTMVLADPQKFMTEWRAQEFPMLQEQDGKKLDSVFNDRHIDIGLLRVFNTPKEIALEYLPETKPEYPMTAAVVTYNAFGNGKIGFTNGMHRTANLANAGAPFIPIALTDGSDIEGFKNKFGWNPGESQNPAPSTTPKNKLPNSDI